MEKLNTNSFKIGYVLLLCTSMAIQGCTGNQEEGAVPEPGIRSSYYTRGIGKYPGNPAEDFSPELLPDKDTYRNIAHLRSCIASSSHDFNMTAQLVTDGIISEKIPEYLELSTPKGYIKKRDREKALDEGPLTATVIHGEDTYMQYTLNNYSKEFSLLNFSTAIFYDEKSYSGGYEFTVQSSSDGEKWIEIGKKSGEGLPGRPNNTKRGRMMVKAPGNNNDSLLLISRNVREKIELSTAGPCSYIRILLKMKGAYEWRVLATDFCNKAGEITDIKPSQYFNSAWMSESSGQEWICVDLGSRSEFDRINLYWINKATKGKIQISDNTEQWTDIAVLPGSTGSKDEISLKGSQKARYVRLLMDRSDGNRKYILSELEIMGKGGLVPHPCRQAAGEEDKIVLSGGNWKLQRASEVTASGEKISQKGFNAGKWIVATVPGTVLSSYLNIGALPNPNYADNQRHISESFFWSDFWYRNEFNVPENFKKERLFLNFDGINWKADIFLNGRKLGRMEGAFIRGNYDVTDLVVPGKNVVAVKIIKNIHIGAIKEKEREASGPNGGVLGADNPTFHASIGWDWIPTIRGRNIGIWNDVYLTSTGNVTLYAPYVKTVLPLPDTTSADLTAEIIVSNHSLKAVSGKLEAVIGDISVSKSLNLAAGEEKNIILSPKEFSALHFDHPHLWWPNGYGRQYLYDASFKFIENGRISDRKDLKVGIRQMTYNDDDNTLKIYVNGRRFIGRGGNWGFSESNLNYRKREYDIAVAYHADMNLTLIRNWVGMIGDKEFYDACDRYGIMVWQDFWLANPVDGPDPYYPEMFITNAKDYVKRIRKHPSIALYCGRNEGYPPKEINKALIEIVKAEHPDMHYIPHSASNTVSGFGPYRMLPAQEYFKLTSGMNKIHSERGMPNIMSYEGVLRTISPDHLWPQDDEWGMHDYTLQGAQRCYMFDDLLYKGYGKPASAKEFAENSQWLNYDGHRAMFESRGIKRKGLLMWMSHSCWPSMVWQTYDFYLEPTAAYFAIKKASSPIHIQWNSATDMIQVVNYHAGEMKGLVAEAKILNMDASLCWEKKKSLDSHEDTTDECIQLEFPESLSKVHYIKLTLSQNGRIISDNFYLRSKDANNYQEIKHLPQVQLEQQTRVTKVADGSYCARVTVCNPSKVPALLVRLNLVGDADGIQILPVLYSDNYFALLPGEEKTVEIRWRDEDSRGNEGRIKISGYNVKGS